MKDLAQQAEVNREELLFGLISVADVVAWADALLAETGEYNDGLANVSLAARACAQDVAGLLRKLAVGADEFEALRCVMGAMHRVLLKDDSRVRMFTRGLEQFYIEHNYDVPEDMRFIASAEDEFDLAGQGVWGTREEVFARFMEHLSAFDSTQGVSSDEPS